MFGEGGFFIARKTGNCYNGNTILFLNARNKISKDGVDPESFNGNADIA